MPALTTRTTNPLPFQDLEPKRFEDVVRQLTYDFRTWRSLEATGRAGSDDGFDARGLEIVDTQTATSRGDDDAEDDGEASDRAPDRLWLVQCKCEKAIGLAKALRYLDEIQLVPEALLHGLIFAAACDFSKRTRDGILEWCRSHGISEVHVWGKGELEDMLFQPKNDNLLFAYFGISLTIRRRTVATQLRGELAMKRKLSKTVATSSADILVRDPAASDYPHPEGSYQSAAWRVYAPEKLTHLGLRVRVVGHYAFIDRATGAWDAAFVVNARELHHYWRQEGSQRQALLQSAREAWDSFPEGNRGWFEDSRFIPYRSILAIDDMGDDVFTGTHLYVPFQPKHGPFEATRHWPRLTTTSHWDGDFPADPEKRIVVFPPELRSKPSPAR